MGKTKKKRLKKHRNNPTSEMTQETPENIQMSNGEEDHVENGQSKSDSFIENILEKLQCSATEERECACLIVASVVSQPDAIRKLLEAKIVKIVAPFMVDKSVELQQVAVGCLRNLSVDARSEECSEMVNQDVMTPLVSLLKQYDCDWHNMADYKVHLAIHEDILVQAINLLWNLSERSEVAMKIFNQENLVHVMLRNLDPVANGMTLSLAIAQCLHIVTEDNPVVSAFICKDEILIKIKSYLENNHHSLNHLLFKTLLSGTLYNCITCDMSSITGSFTEVIVTTLAKCLHEDLTKYISELGCEKRPQASGDKPDPAEDNMEVDESKQTESGDVLVEGQMEKEVTEIINLLNAQQTALEIVTNLCCTNDEAEDWEEIDSSDASSDDFSEVIDSDRVTTTDEKGLDSSLLSPLCVPSEIHSLFVANNLVELVLSKTVPLEDDIQDKIHKHKNGNKLKKSISQVQSRALLCISNLSAGMDSEALGGLDGLHTIWQQLSQSAFNKQVQCNVQHMEGITSAMRSVIQKLAELESPKFADCTAADLQFLFELGHHYEEPDVRVNVIRVVSSIGCILSKQQEPHQLLRDIGVFLLVIAVKDSELHVVAEALDCIMDIFAEDHLNDLMKEVNMIGKLQQLTPTLKVKVNQQRSKGHCEHLPVIHIVRSNLARFIKYKSALIR